MSAFPLAASLNSPATNQDPAPRNGTAVSPQLQSYGDKKRVSTAIVYRDLQRRLKENDSFQACDRGSERSIHNL